MTSPEPTASEVDGATSPVPQPPLTFYWDFFGPRAEPTALHFKKHLDEFLLLNSLLGCETGVSSDGPGHLAAFCRAPSAAQDAIARALRPRRAL